MHLLALSIADPTAITVAVNGNFSAARAQEFAVARTGGVLELLRPDELGVMQRVACTEVFGIIRSMHAFRLTGSATDNLVVGSDSGKLVVLRFDAAAAQWVQVFSEPYGKTGVRRVTPGQYVASDPAGRALMVAAVEKEKLVYVMNRDAAGALTISSPLEAPKSQTLVFDVVGLDVGFENPQFACLEMGYAEADADASGAAAAAAQKMLTLYELDLGLNHVVRKWSDPVRRASNMLLAVPGGEDGPGGVLVCAEGWVSYRKPDHAEVRAPLPRREDMTGERGLLIVAAATHRQKGLFFFLLQSEVGDLYKATLTTDPPGAGAPTVVDLRLQYFDTIPVAASLCITKKGLLFAACEFGDHHLYLFEGLGDGDAEAAAASAVPLGADEAALEVDAVRPRAAPKNLRLVDAGGSVAPVTDMRVADLSNEGTPQIYTTCGRGSRSTLRVLRHGLGMAEIAVSQLPGVPNAVWALRDRHTDAADKFIVVSFNNSTIVLSVGETVEEVSDSKFDTASPTLAVVCLQNNQLVQVTPVGVRVISPGGAMAERAVNEWKPQGGKTVERASSNGRQLLLALVGGELVYFELNAAGNLDVAGETDLGVEVACLDVGEVPADRQRSPFAAVAGYDGTVKLLSLSPTDLFTQCSTQALQAPASSLCLAEMPVGAAAGAGLTALFLYVGLQNGVMQRTAVDGLKGTLTDTRTRFLGSRPVALLRVTMAEQRAVLALSSRSWLSYMQAAKHTCAPLSYGALERAAPFTSEQCDDAIVAVAGDTLRILGVERLGETFNQRQLRLRYTPRKFVVHPQTSQLVVIEADHNEFNAAEKAAIAEALGTAPPAAAGAAAGGAGAEEGGEEGEEEEPVRGPVPAEAGKWASCVRVVDPTTLTTLDLVELPDNEAAVSVAPVVFHDRGGEVFLLVGTVKDMLLHPRSCSAGFVHVYRMATAGGGAGADAAAATTKLQLLHSTEVEGVPQSICGFGGRVLVSVGRVLRIYDLGKKKLLRKCEAKPFPTHITNVRALGDRVYVSDLQEGFHFVQYRRAANQLVVFADETLPRMLVSCAPAGRRRHRRRCCLPACLPACYSL